MINGELDKSGFKEIGQSDFAFNIKINITHFYQNEDTIFCDLNLQSDFHKLLGVNMENWF